MAFTKQNSQENMAMKKYADEHIEFSRTWFHRLETAERIVTVDTLIKIMAAAFPNVSDDRLRSQIFAAIRRKRR